jgi:uncharacterized protein YyaL (SSP411 family)
LLIGSRDYVQIAEKALQSVADNINQTPFHAASFVTLLKAVNNPPLQIILRGEPTLLSEWKSRLLPRLKPGQSAYFIPYEALNLPDEIAQKSSDEAICAWICEGFSCRPPIHDLDNLLEQQDQDPDRDH